MSQNPLFPENFGLPCWDVSRCDHLLQAVALIDAVHAPTFLACHSPVTATTGREGLRSEAQIFDWLFRRTSAETLVVVTGEPGCGKSHLINWIKLRLDDAMSRNEKANIKCVMIKRRSGSLRDALEQLVQQMPEFNKYLDKIQAAIESLSLEIATRQLSFNLSQLLLKNCEEYPRRLRGLHVLFQDEESQKWLRREGGAIDRNIQRLISQSQIDERESLPLFTPEDLIITSAAVLNRSSEAVRALVDVMESAPTLCEAAVALANKELRAALEMLTGLGNQTLHQIFRNIRRDLKAQGQQLALFIEDVSTLSALDVEVVNVLEPQNDPELCRLYSMVGMTDQAYDRLPDNMLNRITERIKVHGGSDDSPLQRDPAFVDKFVARYLNVLRLDQRSVEKVAELRRQGRDVAVTACEECPHREKCFASFGNVELEEQQIGLFPFSPGAAFRLLQGLKVEGAVRRNARGLLQQIMDPLLSSVFKGVEQGPVGMGMMVEPKPARDLSVVAQRLLGGWDDRSKQRLNYLLYYWTGREDLKDGAGILDGMREALRLPAFSQTPSRPVVEKKEADPAPRPSTEPSPAPQRESRGYNQAVGYLEKWSGDEGKLQQDASFRELLVKVVQNCVPWDEVRSALDPVRKRVAGIGTAAIVIEDMVSRPAVGSSLGFDFDRSEATTSLLRASLRFRHLGNNSWNYADSVYDRRSVGRWIQSNAEATLTKADPVDLDPTQTHQVAVLFLMHAYQLSVRKSLPVEYAEAVNELFSFKPASPTALSPTMQRVAQDLPIRVEKVREFLAAELNVPQGAGGILFIDPLPVIRAIANYDGTLPDFAVDPRFGESHWAARFKNILDLGRTSWGRLSEAIADEAKQLKNLYREIRNALDQWQPDQESVQEQVESFLEGCKELKAALAETRQPIGDEGARAVLSRREDLTAIWKSTLGRVEETISGEDPVAVLRFSTEGLLDLRDSISTLMAWAAQTESAVVQRYEAGTGGRNLDEEIKKAHESLDLFSSVTKDNTERANDPT